MALLRAHLKIVAQGTELDINSVRVTESGLSLGRDRTNALTLPSPLVSRHHARFYWQENTLMVEDLGSSNGSWLNDQRMVASTPYPLKLQDSVRFGPFTLTVEKLETPETPSTSNEPQTQSEGDKADALPPAPPLTAPEPTISATLAKEPESPAQTQPEPETASDTDTKRRSRPSKEQAPSANLTVPLPRPATPIITDSTNGRHRGGSLPPTNVVPGIPLPPMSSNWMQYLPAIYGEDEFLGRYLLAFEATLSPIMWILDHFSMFLDANTAPEEWLQWMASWFDILLVPQLEVARQREIVRQLGWLFMRRGTRSGLERLLQLYFGVKPEIIESETDCQFTVKLPLKGHKSGVGREIADTIIQRWKPAFARYTLETD